MLKREFAKLTVRETVKNVLKMSVFTQKLNPITGKCDWEVQNEDYDYHQEVASAAFADMLHDSERNKKYEEALKVAIEFMHKNGRKANVLDIGTGTGLLSMMAVRNLADSVTACEAFGPMSECALKVIKTNGFQHKIKLIKKRSTDIKVGVDGDMSNRANILITEVFDTELIGEGALSTFQHAHQHLLEKNCIVIPNKANIYVQLAESPLFHSWNRFSDVFDDDGDVLLKTPSKIKECLGNNAVHDVQLSQIDLKYVNFLTAPIKIFEFDWGRGIFEFNRKNVSGVQVQRGGRAQAVFMWWDLQMDINNQIVLSCAPYWAHPFLKQSNFSGGDPKWHVESTPVAITKQNDVLSNLASTPVAITKQNDVLNNLTSTPVAITKQNDVLSNSTLTHVAIEKKNDVLSSLTSTSVTIETKNDVLSNLSSTPFAIEQKNSVLRNLTTTADNIIKNSCLNEPNLLLDSTPVSIDDAIGKIPWRDHWMQAIYYLPKEKDLKINQEVNLISYHDEYSLWFDLKTKSEQMVDYSGPICDCNMHLAYSRTRIGELNDKKRIKKYLKIMEKYVFENANVLVLSSGFFLGLCSLKFGAKKVFFYEENLLTKNVILEYAKTNNLENVVVFGENDNLSDILRGEKIDLVLSEPFFTGSIVPWYNLRLIYLLREFHKVFSDKVQIFPKKAIIKTIAVQFKDLYKIRCPLETCEGFNMADFDSLIMASSNISDETVEPQPLWEYPGTAESLDFEICTIDLEKYLKVPEIVKEGTYNLYQKGKCNGLAFWVDWDLDGFGKQLVSTGPVSSIVPQKKIEWYMHVRQGVHLFQSKLDKKEVNYCFNFDPKSGKISLKINV